MHSNLLCSEYRPAKHLSGFQYDDVIDGSANVKKNEKGQEDIGTLELPPNVRRAQNIIQLWESCVPPEYRDIPSSIAKDALQSGKSVLDEPWYGSEAAEKDSYVSEELYIHSKLMIVDDRKVIRFAQMQVRSDG